MSANNRISKVAIVGAGGNSGRYMAEALVATGNHTVTALTRPNSTSPIPAGVRSIAVDYTDKESLIVALRGQDALIITLAVTSPPDTHSTLVEAAAAAGVPWILPNDWTPDTSGTVDTGLITDIASFSIAPTQRAHIASLGVSSYISVITGFWYEWSLAIPAAFGFDFASRTATFFDDGKTQLSLSTWRQVGRAVASLLSLPIEKEEGSSASLADFRNKVIYVASFTTSQAEIFESILRVTGDKREDWKIKYETSRERFEGGVAVLKQGKGESSNTDRDKQTHPTGGETSREQFERGVEAMKQATNQAFVHMLYARVLFPVPGVANTEKMHGLVNGALGLQKEDLDEATRLGIERAQATKT